MKKFITFIMITGVLINSTIGIKTKAVEFSSIEMVRIRENTDLENLNSKAAILMDSETGRILFEKNIDEKLPIASITKVMTSLLIFEALEDKRISLEDPVIVSINVFNMKGSTAWLVPNEVFPVGELLKTLLVNSANDSAVALAEHIYVSESVFVEKMNQKAEELGLENTKYNDVAGLVDEGNYSSARDVAVISRELITKYPSYKEYTTIVYDTFRNGKTDLNNTNRLIQHYKGTTGLKTGFTTKAGHCIAATVKRGDIELIGVVLGASDTNTRFGEVTKILDFGFANFTKEKILEKGKQIPNIQVSKGKVKEVGVRTAEEFITIVNSSKLDDINQEIFVDEIVEAPVKKDQKVGYVLISIDGEELGQVDLVTEEEIEKASFFKLLFRKIASWVGIDL